ncbi:integrase core domain-containing protein [Bacillus sp. ISL-40]|nr:integrase core domain-containing protein [Bacillus sp. ISL-40]MBT2744650.1 integrase core domain-containing protein [Bacillus sp. ISL-77]
MIFELNIFDRSARSFSAFNCSFQSLTFCRIDFKGCPYDNAVEEATFKIIKTEFVKGMYFDSLEQLKLELDDYVHWFNHIRIQGTLGYLSPIEYKKEHLKKVV